MYSFIKLFSVFRWRKMYALITISDETKKQRGYEISCEKGFLEKLVLGLGECLYLSCGYDNNMGKYKISRLDIPEVDDIR